VPAAGRLKAAVQYDIKTARANSAVNTNDARRNHLLLEPVLAGWDEASSPHIRLSSMLFMFSPCRFG
jgi:hypothetical protein